jgi:hypothetical protein
MNTDFSRVSQGFSVDNTVLPCAGFLDLKMRANGLNLKAPEVCRV